MVFGRKAKPAQALPQGLTANAAHGGAVAQLIAVSERLRSLLTDVIALLEKI